MFQIQSERLSLLALSYDELILLSQSRHTLDTSLGLTLSDFRLNFDGSFMEKFDEVLESHLIPGVQSHPDTFQWYTHWLIVERKDNITAGGIGVFGEPDKNGEVMLGYFIDEKYEGKGIATESVKLLAGWLFQNPELKAIVAHTLVDGYGSQKVLQKNGFALEGKSEEGLKWRLQRLKFFQSSKI